MKVVTILNDDGRTKTGTDVHGAVRKTPRTIEIVFVNKLHGQTSGKIQTV